MIWSRVPQPLAVGLPLLAAPPGGALAVALPVPAVVVPPAAPVEASVDVPVDVPVDVAGGALPPQAARTPINVTARTRGACLTVDLLFAMTRPGHPADAVRHDTRGAWQDRRSRS